MSVPVLPRFPDAELVAVAWLKSQAFNVATQAPRTPTRPNLVVTRIGGLPAARWSIDQASLQIDVWGSTKQQARDTAADALHALYVMPGLAGGDQGASVTDVDVVMGLTWQPDDAINPSVPRYLFGVLVTLRATDQPNTEGNAQ